MPAIIQVRELTRRFGDVLAVDRVSFAVEKGEVFGFLGPNGAGKTTMVRMLTGVIEPTEGTATVEGHDVRRESCLARRHIGVVPEEANVYLDLSVWQNVTIMAQLHGVPRREREAHPADRRGAEPRRADRFPDDAQHGRGGGDVLAGGRDQQGAHRGH